MRKLCTALLLGACLSVPAVISAQDHDKRYYDADKKDYHAWNENENRAWRHYVSEERHGKYHDWAKASKAEQRDYWKWRHEHPDWH